MFNAGTLLSQVGCGTSMLQRDMAEDGYTDILSVDNSSVAVMNSFTLSVASFWLISSAPIEFAVWLCLSICTCWFRVARSRRFGMPRKFHMCVVNVR